VFDIKYFFHMVDRHVLSCPQIECCISLEEHHSETVHRLASCLFRHLQCQSLSRGIDRICHDQVRTEEGFIRDHGLSLKRLHADACCLCEKITVSDLFS